MTVARFIHITTVHARTDPRIRYKEADALARAFPHETALFVQDGHGDEVDTDSSLRIHDTGSRPKGRLRRMIFGSMRMFRAVRRAHPEIAHFHDPELIPVGVLLSFFGIKVIYDSHEDVPKQILAKTYIGPKWVRGALSRVFSIIEQVACYRFAGVVVPAKPMLDKFSKFSCLAVHNFPRADLMVDAEPMPRSDDRFIIIYAGSLSHVRGTLDLVDAMSLLSAERFVLHLAGTWNSSEFEATCRAHPGWKNVNFLGKLPYSEVASYISQADLGVQITRDIPNHRGGLPTKVFEYMFCKTACLLSDTDEKRAFFGDLVSYVKAGDADRIADTIKRIEADRDAIAEQTEKSYQYAKRHFSWDGEGEKLVSFYENLLGEPRLNRPEQGES